MLASALRSERPQLPQIALAFRRFKRELYEEYPELVSAWHAFRDTRAKRRAVEWLLGEALIEEAVAEQFLGDNPDPDVP